MEHTLRSWKAHTIQVILAHALYNYFYVHTLIILGTHQVPGDLPTATVILIIVMSLISSGSVFILIVLILLMLVRAHKRIQNPPSTCVNNNAIYEEPDHHINTDQTIAISDNVAYSVTKGK